MLTWHDKTFEDITCQFTFTATKNELFLEVFKQGKTIRKLTFREIPENNARH